MRRSFAHVSGFEATQPHALATRGLGLGVYLGHTVASSAHVAAMHAQTNRAAKNGLPASRGAVGCYTGLGSEVNRCGARLSLARLRRGTLFPLIFSIPGTSSRSLGPCRTRASWRRTRRTWRAVSGSFARDARQKQRGVLVGDLTGVPIHEHHLLVVVHVDVEHLPRELHQLGDEVRNFGSSSNCSTHLPLFTLRAVNPPVRSPRSACPTPSRRTRCRARWS